MIKILVSKAIIQNLDNIQSMMKDDMVRINKILANSTRREILEIINQRGETTYADIRQTLGQMNTGRLNYHLRMIGNLISKEAATGKYMLTNVGAAVLAMKVVPDLSPSHNNNAEHGHQGKNERRLDALMSAGVIVPIVILSTYTYYLFSYLGIVKISTIVTVSMVWAVVVFFIWRGLILKGKANKTASGIR